MLKVFTRVLGVEGVHVPLIDERHGERIPRLISVLEPQVRFAIQRSMPVSSGEGPVVAND